MRGLTPSATPIGDEFALARCHNDFIAFKLVSVIMIIVILVVVLLLLLKRARGTADRIICASNRLVLTAALIFAWAGDANALSSTSPYNASDKKRLQVIRDYADSVLGQGRDKWSGKQTPLFADGLNVDTGQPVVWLHEGEAFIISNLANQQNLFRTLVGLTRLTGDSAYENAAKDAIRYHFDHQTDDSGLLKWGGHQFVDLASLTAVGHFDADCHEFKNNFPYYELMWEVDSQATIRFLHAFWNAHILDWSVLDMNRHGQYGQAVAGNLWDRSFDNPPPFFESDGLTFINAGSDLIYAASMLRTLNGEESAWTWGRRLARMYVDARHPATGLGAYQFSKPERIKEPPEGPLEGQLTFSRYGDRAENQFGKQFGDFAMEGWVLWGNRVKTIYVKNGFMQLGVAESMGSDGEELLKWTTDGLQALARHSYMPHKNAFRPMWANGTDLTGKSFNRTGYYGEADTEWQSLDADAEFLMTYARAYRLSGHETLWNTARNIALGIGMGDIGHAPGQVVSFHTDVENPSPHQIFALLEIYRIIPHEAYLNHARLIADALISRHYHHGFFLPGKDHIHANFDTLEPLAILTLDAILRGVPEIVPAYIGGRSYIHGKFDGHGRTYDQQAIWSVTRP